MPPKKNAERAQLRELVARAKKALEDGQQEALDAALDELRKFARNTLDSKLRAAANEAHDAVNNANMAAGIDALSKIADRLKVEAAPVLDQAAAGAAHAKENLFFPKLAKSAQKALDKVVQVQKDLEGIKKEADQLRQQIGEVDELAELPAALDSVTALLEKLKKKAEKK